MFLEACSDGRLDPLGREIFSYSVIKRIASNASKYKNCKQKIAETITLRTKPQSSIYYNLTAKNPALCRV